MNIGDLVYDDHYGYGIVLEVEIEAGEYIIHFQKAPAGTTVIMDEHLASFMKVLNASR